MIPVTEDAYREGHPDHYGENVPTVPHSYEELQAEIRRLRRLVDKLVLDNLYRGFK